MKRAVLALLFSLFAFAASAQNVTVIGPITPGDCPQFSSTTVIKDSGFNCNGAAGGPAGGVLSGTYPNPGFSSAVNSALTQTNAQFLIGTGAFGFSSLAPQAALNAIHSACGVVTAGTINYFNGTNWVCLAGNTSGTQTLTENASGVPSWSASGAGSVTSLTAAGGATTDTGSAITTTGNISVQQMNPGGRLTLTSGTPITTTDVTNATTIFYAPLNSEFVPIFNGTVQKLFQFTSSSSDTVGLSVTLGSNWASGSAYDWFIALNGGTVTLCSGPAWSSATAGSSSRGTGAGTTQLALFNGVWTNAVSLTCRFNNTTTFTVAANQGTYIGSTLMTAAGAATDSAAQRYLFNLYNTSQRKLKNVTETTASWNFSPGSPSFRQANGNANDQISVFMGQPGSLLDIHVYSAGDSSPLNFMAVGIGINSTTTDNSDSHQLCTSGSACPLSASLMTYPPLGLQNYIWIEGVGVAGGTNTFIGQQINSGVTTNQSGIFASMLN